jgi:hypothetical protein
MIPYLHGTSEDLDIKGRTIHSDGTVIPLVGKPADLLVAKVKNKGRRAVAGQPQGLHLPSVEVGSILEYRYQSQNDDNISSPHWEIQQPYFVHKAHYLHALSRHFLHGSHNSDKHYLVDEYGRCSRHPHLVAEASPRRQ